MGVILKENNIIYTKNRHDKLLGSSKYRFTNSDKIVLKEKKTPIIPTFETETVTDGFKEDRKQYLGIENRYVSENETQSIEVEHLEKEQREYRLNKKKVREKCSAFFGLKQSRKFLAFYTFSFPCGFPDENALRCLNSVFTSMRETCGLKTYLRVSEYQKNGTIHFHVLTNNYMYVRRVNSLMAKSIAYQIKRYKLDVSFDIEKYNGVDVKHVNNNKKALNGYLTKYVSKNDIVHYKIPYHSSRDISELFTAESFTSIYDADFKFIADILKQIETFVIDNEYCTIEYLNQKQSNGKYFNPPDKWYYFRDMCNEMIYQNHHSKNKLKVIPLYQN